MKEIIVRMTNDRIKLKGGEYVADLVRCKECRYFCDYSCTIWESACKADDFCSYGEVSNE